MRFLLIFAVFLISVFATAGLVSARSLTPSQSQAGGEIFSGPIAAAYPSVPSVTSASTGSAVTYDKTFSTRFGLVDSIKNLTKKPTLSPVSSAAANRACVPTQGFNAYGFYTLDEPRGKVDFSVYSRVLYYSLTPGPLGNLKIPSNWDGINITRSAHQHGAKVDLVISNDTWNFAKNDMSDEPDTNGLLLGKSYVLLNMVDEIVDTTNQFGFDGVVIDFRLPKDDPTRESFRFFIKRLKDRLNADKVSGKPNDLLKTSPKQLSVIIDGQSSFKITDGDPKIEANAVLGGVIASTFDSVDVWIVPGEQKMLVSDVKELIGDQSPSGSSQLAPQSAIIMRPSDVKSALLELPISVVWDVANQNPDKAPNAWSPELQEKIYGTGANPKHAISSLACTQRTTILGGLSVVTPLLVLLLVLSWVLYGFPYLVDRTKATLALWGLLVVAIAVFLVLVWSLPSVNFMHIGVYTIVGSLVVPVLYFIFTVLSQLTRPKYP